MYFGMLRVRWLTVSRGALHHAGSLPQILAMCRASQELSAVHVDYLTLRLAGLNLRSLPDIHVAAPLLRVLDLAKNGLAVFPPQLWALQSLEILNLAENRISAIDACVDGKGEGVGQAQMLRCASCDLSRNRLTSSPAALFCGFPSLTHLDVGGNPLTAVFPLDLPQLPPPARRLRPKPNACAAGAEWEGDEAQALFGLSSLSLGYASSLCRGAAAGGRTPSNESEKHLIVVIVSGSQCS